MFYTALSETFRMKFSFYLIENTLYLHYKVREVIALYCENLKIHINKLCWGREM
jgi:hypothetical protein